MRCSVHFFAMNADDVAFQFRDRADEIAVEVADRIATYGGVPADHGGTGTRTVNSLVFSLFLLRWA